VEVDINTYVPIDRIIQITSVRTPAPLPVCGRSPSAVENSPLPKLWEY
jgi:hypothetical protein